MITSIRNKSQTQRLSLLCMIVSVTQMSEFTQEHDLSSHKEYDSSHYADLPVTSVQRRFTCWYPTRLRRIARVPHILMVKNTFCLIRTSLTAFSTHSFPTAQSQVSEQMVYPVLRQISFPRPPSFTEKCSRRPFSSAKCHLSPQDDEFDDCALTCSVVYLLNKTIKEPQRWTSSSLPCYLNFSSTALLTWLKTPLLLP